MIHEHGSGYGNQADGHDKFRQFSALSNSGTLSPSECLELEDHLRTCSQCREIHQEYRLLASAGMPFLATAHPHPQDHDLWDPSPARERLWRSLHQDQVPGRAFENYLLRRKAPHSIFLASASRQGITAALAACLLIAVSLISYRLGRIAQSDFKPLAPFVQTQPLTVERTSADPSLDEQAATIAHLEARSFREQQEVNRLQSALHALENESSALAAARSESQQQLVAVSRQRDGLLGQLQQAEQAYRSAQAELAALRSEHDEALLRQTSLESKLNALSAGNHELEQRLADDERFLASDRDIRELMGARQLYIADVFDVDSRSRTRKPFGRVFYTQNKSLIFYAFDLDRGPGVKNASIFQVWGQKDSDPAAKERPTNLGILYMDSESNRRWVLRLDDPKQVAQIDAVFVTVEPHAGSLKPSGKPLLYALLRKEANHP